MSSKQNTKTKRLDYFRHKFYSAISKLLVELKTLPHALKAAQQEKYVLKKYKFTEKLPGNLWAKHGKPGSHHSSAKIFIT